MHFAQPYWLIVGLVTVTLLAALLIRAEHLRSRALAVLVHARLRAAGTIPSRARRWLRVLVATLAVAMGFVALARPQNGMRWETVERSGIDLMLVVDTSKSMDADDVKPSRLERSKLAIRDLVERFPGDRIGVVAFAGDAFVESPMTLDHTALLETVDELDTSVVARGGTNIGRGIDAAATALATEPSRQKIMVLLTDGEDLEGQGLAEARAAAAAGITIDTVGVGTAAGELVPIRDAHGKAIGVARDEDGKVVRSHLDEPGLRAIAEAAHGSYRPLGEDGRGLDRLYDASLAKLTHAEASSRTHRVYVERFEIPLALALFGIVLDSLLGVALRRRRPTAKRAARTLRTNMALAAGVLCVAAPLTAHASVATATKAYAAGRFDEATRAFQQESARSPKDARLAFNAGDAAYRAGHYDVAEAAFKSALSSAEPHLQQRVLYNEGDVLYRAGESQKPEARDETIAKWKAAIAAYDGALALDSKDADARFNRDFVAKRLKALEEQKKDEPKKNDSNDSKGGQGSKDGKKDSTGAGATGDSKDSPGPGAQDAKPNGTGGSRATPNSGQQPGSPDTGGSKPGLPQGQSGSARSTTSPGASPAPGTRPGDSAGEDGHGANGEAPQVGRLSARDARALLGALRGDERRGLVRASSGDATSDDTPRKDW